MRVHQKGKQEFVQSDITMSGVVLKKFETCTVKAVLALHTCYTYSLKDYLRFTVGMWKYLVLSIFGLFCQQCPSPTYMYTVKVEYRAQ